VAAPLGDRSRARDERRGGNHNRAGDARLESDYDRGRPCEHPIDIDRVIVGRQCADGWTCRARRQMNVHVHRRRGRVVQLLGMNVRKRRLKEAPGKGRNARNCAGCPHKFFVNFSIKSSVPEKNGQKITGPSCRKWLSLGEGIVSFDRQRHFCCYARR
jgi:hypothetical protein